MLDNLKKIKNFNNQGFELEKKMPIQNHLLSLPKKESLDLQMQTKRVWITNALTLLFGTLNVFILTYLYFFAEIVYLNTGWLKIPQAIHWYNVFLSLILLRLFVVFISNSFADYIKDYTLWSAKKKTTTLNVLALINLFTIPFSFPFLGLFYGYVKGQEILSQHWLLGTFRRILNEKERSTLFQESVQNFFDKMEASKQVKDQLQNWVRANAQSFLDKYDDGSALGTEYLSKQLTSQKEIFERIELENAILNQKGYVAWMAEKTLNVLTTFNPFVTEPKTCMAAWGLLLISGVFVILIVNNKMHGDEIQALRVDVNSLQANSDNIVRNVQRILSTSPRNITSAKLDAAVEKACAHTGKLEFTLATIMDIVKETLKNLFGL